MSTPSHILWLDFETTGSGDDAEIIEVGAALTPAQPGLPVLSSFSTPVRASQSALAAMPSYVIEMHTANGLLDELPTAPPLWLAEIGTLGLLAGVKGKVPIGGSGVGHFDRALVHRFMPKLNERLTYYTIDIGPTRRMLDLLGAPRVLNEPKTHRAADCVRIHLAEARRYLNLLRPRCRCTEHPGDAA